MKKKLNLFFNSFHGIFIIFYLKISKIIIIIINSSLNYTDYQHLIFKIHFKALNKLIAPKC